MQRTLCVERYSSIHEIGEPRWDSIVSDRHFFHSFRFVSAIEDAKVMDASFHYLLFVKDGILVASAVLSAFEIGLELFLGRRAQAIVKLVRSVFPGFFRIKILFSGLPVSIGKYNIIVSGEEHRPEVAAVLLDEMAAIASENRISFLCVKEFPEHEDFYRREIADAGYMLLDSLPYGSIDIEWNSFSDYIRSLKHGYRRLVKKSLDKMCCTEPRIVNYGDVLPGSGAPSLVLERGELVTVKRFHSQYMQVMRRARVKLETLNEDFFSHLIGYMRGKVELLSFLCDGNILGSAIVVTSGKKMTFLLIGLDYKTVREWDMYFNLMYGIVSLAISRNCETLDMGQTSEYAKQRLGAKFVPEYFYLKSTHRTIHHLLRLARKILFPAASFPVLSVFREANIPPRRMREKTSA